MYHVVVISRIDNLETLLTEVRHRFVVSHVEERQAQSTIFFYEESQQKKAAYFLESEGAEILVLKIVS